MHPIKKIVFLFLLISYRVIPSQTVDTLPASPAGGFLETLKRYYCQKVSYELNKTLFTQWAKKDSEPFNYIYVSKLNKVENKLGEYDYIYAGQDTSVARLRYSSYSKIGLSVFHYKSFGTADSKLTKKFLSYPAEAKAFIVFHELTHNYFIEKKIDIKYSLNEAACDAVAVSLCKQLFKEKNVLDKKNVKAAVKAMEAIYKTINSTISKISGDTLNYLKLCELAQTEIKKQIRPTDAFFNDRFNYPVNTAFLLKNKNYCKRYFEVSKLYKKSKTFEEFVNKLINLSKANDSE